MKGLKYNPNYCIACRCCMTVKSIENIRCQSLIDMIKRGGPKFGYKECASSNCTECVDICPSHALTK